MTLMTDMTPVGIEDWESQRALIRLHNTGKIREVLTALEPGVMGWTGPINPSQVKVYLQALRELGQLWGAYEPPKPVEVAETGELALEAQRAAVLAELETLAARAVLRRGRPGASRELG